MLGIIDCSDMMLAVDGACKVIKQNHFTNIIFVFVQIFDTCKKKNVAPQKWYDRVWGSQGLKSLCSHGEFCITFSVEGIRNDQMEKRLKSTDLFV